MIKKTKYILVISILLYSIPLLAQQRGMKVVRTSQGASIPLYKGSYALVIGNGNYFSGWDPLPGAIQDVEEVATILKKNGFEVELVKNANKNTFLSALRNFTYKHGQDPDNQLLLYFAGHGHTIQSASDEKLGYLVMVDAPLQQSDPIGFDSRAVDMQTIITYAKMIKSKHVLFIFDSCFSGTILNLREQVTPKAIDDVVRYPVRQFITAGRADEPVPDRSVFKRLFIDILEGKVEEPIKDGYLTGEELGLYLKSKVPEYYREQHPQYGKIRDPNLDKGDFVFVIEKPIFEQPEQVVSGITGSLELSVPDDSKIFVDDTRYYSRKIQLTPGPYILKISVPDSWKQQDFSTEFMIKPNETVTIEYLFGELLIACQPFARIYIDGKFFKETEGGRIKRILQGDHLIRVEKSGYPSFEESVKIRANSRNRLILSYDYEQNRWEMK